VTDNVNIDNLIADSGYYAKELVENLSQFGNTPVIPPPSHAVLQGKSDTTWHDKIVKYIEEKGIYAFHKKCGYRARAKMETQFSRVKLCIGEALLTQRI
jgi:16S rRNA U516 pseudouridylate synthase RsuA-like enzyme